jgi:hypothetical protein
MARTCVRFVGCLLLPAQLLPLSTSSRGEREWLAFCF